jgi:hypothetical protein
VFEDCNEQKPQLLTVFLKQRAASIRNRTSLEKTAVQNVFFSETFSVGRAQIQIFHTLSQWLTVGHKHSIH